MMAMPLIGHRDPRFVAEVRAVAQKLRGLFLTEAHAMVENCPATALMEAGIRNLVPRGGRVLHLSCGAFGERWVKVSKSCGRTPVVLEASWGSTHKPEVVRELLLTSPPFEAVAITHNETSTGVTAPLAELAATVREVSSETLILVDAVSSVGGIELRFDEWGLDLAFAGTQKCLALPPGLTVFAVSKRGMRAAEGVEERGFLLDFVKADKGMREGRTVATPCVPLVFALSRQLDRVAEETLETRWARHREMRGICLGWAEEQGYAPFVQDPAARSATVSCIDARGADVQALAERAEKAGYHMDRGYGDLKGVAFRVGHMGDHTPERLREFLAAISG